MVRVWHVALLLLVMVQCADRARADWLERTWTSNEGKTLKAKFIRATSTMVTLNQEGKVLRVPLERFIEADREWITAADDLKKMREWKLSDGTSHRARLLDIYGETLTLQERSEELQVSFDQLIKSDRELVAKVMVGTSPFAYAPPTPGVSRTWTHRNGNSIDAEYRGIEGDNVVLYFQEKEWRVPMTDLSESDRQFVTGQQPGSSPTSGTLAQGTTPPGSGAYPASSAKPPGEMTQEERIADLLRKRRERAERLAQNPPPPTSPPPQVESPDIADVPPPSRHVWNEPEPFIDRRERYSPSPIREPTYPQQTLVRQEVVICSKCGHQHPATRFKAGQMCQGCGVLIGYIQNEDGTVRETSIAHRVGQIRGVVWAGIMGFALLGALVKKLAG